VSQNAKTVLLAIVLLAICWLMAMPAVAQKAPSAPQPLPVNVVNTPNVNVANTPSVSVTNTPSVNVSNTPNVNVGNTPNVNVANTPTVSLSSGTSVNVANALDGQGNPTPLATLEAVQIYGSQCFVVFSGLSYGSCNLTAVPEGKRLVVQEFDAQGTVESGNRPIYIQLVNTISGGNVFTYMFMVNANGSDYLATHQETRLFVAAGQTPQCAVGLGNDSNGSYRCEISGFLVDVSSGEQGIIVKNPQPLNELFRRSPGR